MKLLFVVHRYAPYPGGSEIYVQSMAEESFRRGHDVTVLAGEHKGDLNGIKVSNDGNILLQHWDLIIVHGGDVNVQNFVLSNAKNIPSKILYMIVLPSTSNVCLQALKDCAYIGCSTKQDWDHCSTYNVLDKAVKIRHGIKLENCIGTNGFKTKYNIPENKKMFISCGGYWPNKAMIELAKLFENLNLDDSVLVTTGYDNRMNLMPSPSDNVIPLLLDNREDVLSAIKEADCVLMHSYQEGFGLVLLEAMVNKTPWIARKIAGANELKDYGQTYSSDIELCQLLKVFFRHSNTIENAYNYAISNHLISNTIDDIENILLQNN